MIILFNEYETEFSTLGIGVLKDAIKCEIKEGLNDEFELTMQYPITGELYNEIKYNRLILSNPNPFDNPQPFRIDGITKPINGIVEITAKHISYDTNALPVDKFKGTDLNTTIEALNNPDNSFVKHNFRFSADFSSGKTFETKQIFNLRSILMGDDEESLLGVYDAEVKFDKFKINITKKRGRDRGATVRYGYNMTDLKHETTIERLYNGVLPYYHTESESTDTDTDEVFPKAYIVGSKPFVDGWLSFSEGGEPYHPIDSSPVQIATEGEYKDLVYSWDATYQRYRQKIYNESVTLIENIASPGWVRINWGSFPTIKIVANAKGYYKLSTDDTWGDLMGPGDVIYEGNVIREGISGLASNMILYFAEVIPASFTSTTTEVNNVIDVRLDDPIIWLDTADAKDMTHNRILLLDLTSEFDDEPSQDALKAKAIEYISKHKVGSLYHSTSVSFINLDEDIYQGFDHVELGDTVHIVYEDAGINTDLRVISTTYDALQDKYISVDLGVKPDNLATSSIQNGDSISSLTNDAGYADITTVNKLIADIVTANYINAANATLSKAQIEELSVVKINVPGIIEASQYSIDNLVAKLLTADNAVIKQKLEAGEISVRGNIDIINGSISLGNSNDTYFNVDRNGNVIANSVEITGGTLFIGDNFSVNKNGDLIARNAYIQGSIETDKATITGGTIQLGQTTISSDNFSSNDITDINAGSIKFDTMTTKLLQLGDGNLSYHKETLVPSYYVYEKFTCTPLEIPIIDVSNRKIIYANSGAIDLYQYNINTNKMLSIAEPALNSFQLTVHNYYYRSSSIPGLFPEYSVTANSSKPLEDNTIYYLDNNIPDDRFEDGATTYLEVVHPTSGPSANSNDYCIFENRTVGSSYFSNQYPAFWFTGIPVGKNSKINPNGLTVKAIFHAEETICGANVYDGYFELTKESFKHSDGTWKKAFATTNTVTIRSGASSVGVGSIEIPFGRDNFPTIHMEGYGTSWDEWPSYAIVDPQRVPQYTKSTVSEGIQSDSTFMPYANNTYDLGTADFKWKNIYADNGTIQTSDRRLKDDINYDIAKFSDVFDKLKPVSYRLKSDPTKVHTGLIAQDIEAVLDEYNLDDYALLNKQKDSYGLSYTEVIAMLVYEVQKLKEKIND